MGRHAIPPSAAGGGVAGPGSRRARHRTTVVVTVLVLAAGAGVVVLRGGLVGSAGACRHGTVRIGAVAAPDIAPVLAAVADRARADHETTDGACLDVRVTAKAPADVAAALGGAKKPDFTVWVPDDSIWLDQVAATGRAPVLTRLGSVAHSPVVLGVLAPQAAALGWPSRTYTWAELAGAAGGRPDLRLGTADPTRNATGMLAMAMINASLARGGGGAGADADTQSAAAAKVLAQHTAPSDAGAVASLPRTAGRAELTDPRRDHALILSEQAAFARNSGPAPGLRLFYPKDGAAELDYPYASVDSGGTGDGGASGTDKARAARRFLSLLGQDAGLRALTGAGFRAPGAGSSPATVERAGGRDPQPVTASPAPSPAVSDVQKLRLMWQITVQSARITTVVDVSGSMGTLVPGSGGRTRLDVTKESLRQALAQFTPKDEIGLWRFSTRLDGPRDYQQVVATGPLGAPVAGGGTQRDRLDAAFRALEPVPDGATGLYDTALAVYRQAVASSVPGDFNAVVILTDGANEDPGSISLDALTAQLKALGKPQLPVPLIAIAVGADADKSACDRMAAATGGAAYRVDDPSQIQAVLLRAVVAAATSAAAKAP